MPTAHRGAISFGLVHIPVVLHTAIQDNDIHFNQLCKEDGPRVRYKKVCTNCGKEVGTQDIIKGFEFAPGQYVTMTDIDFEKVKTKKDKTIQILHFTGIHNTRPIYFDKAYHAVVEAGGDKAYELLHRAMLDEGEAAIAKIIMGQSEKLPCLILTPKGMLVKTLFFADEVKEIPREPTHPELQQQELDMAKMLINSMNKEFEPELYHDEYQIRLRQIIEAKINSQEIVNTPAEHRDNAIDIMEVLQRSPTQVSDNKPPTRRKPRKKAATA